MQMSCQQKTSDGKRKKRGRKKPLMVKQSKQKLQHLKLKYGLI
jgi:hypothetical protein